MGCTKPRWPGQGVSRAARDPVAGSERRITALIIHRAELLRGEIVIGAEALPERVCRIIVTVENTTPLPAIADIARDKAQRFALASTHIALASKAVPWCR
jgi:hypothetical protein